MSINDNIAEHMIIASKMSMIFNIPWVVAFLPVVTGGLLIADGAVKIPSAVAVYKEHKASLLPLILAIALPIILGIVLIAYPIAGIAAMVACFGAFMTAVGVMDIISIMMINRVIRKEAGV